jgi:hypothetical protein
MKFIVQLRSFGLHVLTFSYHGPLHHYTVYPIKQLVQHQNDSERIKTGLQSFKTYKLEELEFVKKAVSFELDVPKSQLIFHTGCTISSRSHRCLLLA